MAVRHYNWCLFVCVALLSATVQATISDLRLRFSASTEAYYGQQQPVWSLQDSPAGKEQPHVSLDLTFQKMEGNPSVEVFVYPASEFQNIGVRSDNTIRMCCTEEMKKDGKCDTPGRAAWRRSDLITRFHIEFKGGSEIRITEKLKVEQSDNWAYLIVSCSSVPSTVEVVGTVSWVNSYGYLKAGYYQLLPFYLVMAILYILFSIPFLILCFIYRHEILKVQLGVAIVFLIGIMETFTWYAYYRQVNATGYYPSATTMFGIIITIAKKCFARVVVLVVCMGLGVTKLSIGTTKYKVGALALAYTLFALMYEYNELAVEQGRIVPTSPKPQLQELAVFVGLSFCDVLFLYWIFVSLIRTTHQLALRRQPTKLKLFKRLLYVFIGAAVVSFILAVLQIILSAAVFQGYEWKKKWSIEAFNELVFFVVLLVMAFLWRPRKNNTRYGMSELVDESDETTVQLQTVGGELTQRVDAVQQYESDREKNIKEASEGNAELQMIETMASFTLVDEEDEEQMAIAKGKMD